MRLPTPSYALTGYVAAAALTVGFAVGFYVESLRWDASLAKVERAAVKQQNRQQDRVDQQSTSYETERTHEVQHQIVYRDRIRTVFKDRVVAESCAAPDDARRVLAEAVARANSRAAGEPVDELPAAPESPQPADRPRALRMGTGDDRALRRLREPTSAYDPSLAAQPLKFNLIVPEVAF